MKAALALLLASAATATTVRNCRIPAPYVAAGDMCTGPSAGYLVYGVCISFLSPRAWSLTSTSQVRSLLTSMNTNVFTAAMTGTALGCSVPPSSDTATWFTGGNTNTVAPLNTVAGDTKCGAMATYSPTAAPGKGVEVRCDRLNGYWPIQGFEGTALCGDGLAAFGDYPVPGTAPVSDFWFSAANQAVDYTVADTSVYAMATEFSGTNALVCSRGCVLPASICSNGALGPNIVGTGTGFDLATCTVAPNRANIMTTVFTFTCSSGLRQAPVFTATCLTGNVNGVTAAATTYTGQCGGADGASSTPLFNNNGALNNWVNAQQGVGSIFGFNQVTSQLVLAYPVVAGAFASAREWNDNTVQLLRDGAVYNIIVNGCTGADRVLCVQRTLNWWRCYYGFPFEGAICYAGNVTIACPTPELGFACPSSSKKGLLGLLGLLGLIPLLLLCCCLLFLCCIRRRKTEADVHFATFDPHAAPMVGTAHCVNPMMTAPCAGSFAPATMPVM